MQVVYYDIETKLALGNARAVPSLDALLEIRRRRYAARAGNAADHQMIGAAQLARMKKGAHLINASRGTVVDIDALADGAEVEHLAGAASTYFPSSPRRQATSSSRPCAAWTTSSSRRTSAAARKKRSRTSASRSPRS